TQV
ncbi:phage small terminase subunit, partial [Escherichia coli EC1865]